MANKKKSRMRAVRAIAAVETLENRHLLSGTTMEVLPAFGEPGTVGANTVQAAQFWEPSDTLQSPPVFHSLPDAQAKVFLDFDGNLEPRWGGNSNVLTPAFDIDGVPDQFGLEEQRRIHEAWSRVAEDFAPFNIDVTTEDPSASSTQLRQATFVSQRTRTFYFRHSFQVEDVSAVTDATIRVQRDDGVAIYLNGTEIGRDNLQPNANYDDLADSAISGNDESNLVSFSLDTALLVPGENVIAVEMHQSSDTSSDVSFDLRFDATVAGQANQSLVPLGAEWSYLDDGSDQGTAWKDSDFNDADWPTGRAQFGYGDSDEVTALRARPDGGGPTRTFYFRHEFDVAQPTELQELQLGLLRDDGAAVYLNGTEIVRDNLRRGADFDDLARSTVGGDDESTFFPFTVESDLLVPGRNVLAVEVHQISDTSSDVAFDLRLTGERADETQQRLVAEGSDWRYLDDGSDQGTAWQATDFGDQTWPIGTSQFGYGNSPGTVHIAIGPQDWFGETVGGVAFVGAFDLDDRTVAYAFTNGFGPSGKNIAEVASHEAGHTFGLQHQGVYDPETGEQTIEYNPGSGNWAPIMGNAYSPVLSTWHDGPAGSRGAAQDDMSVIARTSNGFGFRQDDHGQGPNSSTPLLPDSLLPDSLLPDLGFQHRGIIEQNDDQDGFSFSLSEGQDGIYAQVVGAEFGTNLDAVLEIRDANNEVVAIDDSSAFDAELEAQLPPGNYVLLVRNNGEYGRVGQYTLTGSIDELPSSIELQTVGSIAPNVTTGSTEGTINFDDDTDQFFVAGNEDDFLTAVITPTNSRARLTVEIPGVVDLVQGSTGRSVVLPATAFDESGQLNITVGANRATDYTIEVGANAQLEAQDTDNENRLLLQTASDGSQTVIGTSEEVLESESIVATDADWRYLDDGSDQGEQWREPQFDDSNWPQDRGEFGYGDGDEQTLLQRASNGTRTRTFYFRHEFELVDVHQIANVDLRLKFDDGMAVYVNGTEAARDNLAQGAGHRDFAVSAISSEGTFRTFELDASLLRTGANVIAIEVHQTSDTSSDVSMSAQLNVSRRSAAVDWFTFDVAPEEVDIPLGLQLVGRGTELRNQRMELLGPDGIEVLATSQTAQSPSIDLEIVNWVPETAGTYSVKLTSSAIGSYVLNVSRTASTLLPGDANADGRVDFIDFLALSTNFSQEGSWEDGDFDADGLVAFTDFLILSTNFGRA